MSVKSVLAGGAPYVAPGPVSRHRVAAQAVGNAARQPDGYTRAPLLASGFSPARLSTQQTTGPGEQPGAGDGKRG